MSSKAAGPQYSLLTDVPASIFRAYDIRGEVGTFLTPDVVYSIGRAVAATLAEQGRSRIVLGRDCRLSSPELSQAVCAGLREGGIDVTDIGVVPTPLVYFATHHLPIDSGLMVTGSHNPPQDNGLKIVLSGKTLSESEITGLYTRIKQNNDGAAVANRDLVELAALKPRSKGKYTEANVIPAYLDSVVSRVSLSRPLKVVVDSGNGAASVIAPVLFERLGCEVIPLYCELDGHFPNHHPDPSVAENLQPLIEAVSKHQADIGLAFDGDGDRLGVVSSVGEIIWPDRQLMLFSTDLLSRCPGANIVFDVKCSRHLPAVIQQAGGKPHLCRSGHSMIKAKMIELGAPLAGEMSGHIFFKERWFGFDDGLYAGARLLELLSAYSGEPATFFDQLPHSVSTPEIKLAVEGAQKFDLIEKIITEAREQFPKAELITIDGLCIGLPYGWGLVRASNTTACLTLRFEAETEADLARIQAQFRTLLLAVKPDWELPF